MGFFRHDKWYRMQLTPRLSLELETECRWHARTDNPTPGALGKGDRPRRLCTSPIRVRSRIRIQRFGGVVSDCLYNTQPFRPSLPEQDPIAHGQVLRPLHESECHRCPITGPYKRSIDVNDGACLADRADMQHGLILCLDGGCVREDQDFGDEFPVDFGRSVEFGKHDHAFADFLPSDPFQSEGGWLTGAANWDRDAFPLDRANVGCGELA